MTGSLRVLCNRCADALGRGICREFVLPVRRLGMAAVCSLDRVCALR